MKTKLINFLILFSLGVVALIVFFGLNLTKASAAPAIARFYSPDESQVYFEGQTMTIDANFNEIGLKVTADLSKVDRAMPKNMPVIDNQSGTYTLTTPALSGTTMVIGSDIAIPFTLIDASGNQTIVLSNYTVDIRTYPKKAGADIEGPVRLDAGAGDGQVTLWWSSIDAADSILIRYSDSQGQARQVQVPATNNSMIIRNLENNFSYTFLVAGRHSSGTIGQGKTVTVEPSAPVISNQIKIAPPATPKRSVLPVGGQAKKIAAASKQIDSGQSVTESKPAQVVETPKTAEEVASTESTNENASAKDWSRILLLVSILIIAAGIIIGGYYGYEWYLNHRIGAGENNPKNKSRW